MLQVKTPNGYKKFDGIKRTLKQGFISTIYYDNEHIKVTSNHLLKKDNNEFIEAKKLKVNDYILHENQIVKINKIVKQYKKQYVYDLLEVQDGNQYYTNKVVSHNCSFSGSSHTLIDAGKIENMKKEAGIEDTLIEGGIMYHDYNPTSKYLVSADTSKSLGGEADNDYLCIQVLELNSKIKQAFTYRTNTIHYKEASKILYDICMYYGAPLCVVENNEGSGTYIVNTLFDTLEYENVYFDPNHGDLEAGVRTNKKNREVGLKTLKKLIESDLLNIVNANTIDEFKTFIKINKKYEADKGSTDDCIMSLCVAMYVLLDLNNDIEITIDDYLDGEVEFVADSDSNDIDFYESSKKTNSQQELLQSLFG